MRAAKASLILGVIALCVVPTVIVAVRVLGLGAGVLFAVSAPVLLPVSLLLALIGVGLGVLARKQQAPKPYWVAGVVVSSLATATLIASAWATISIFASLS